MKRQWAYSSIGAVLMAAATSTGVMATGKCDGVDIANGAFAYTALSVPQASFNGGIGSPVSTAFTCTAPSVDSNHRSDLIDVFPGEGQLPCATTALAEMSVEIQKVGDSDGNPITPVGIDPASTLGQAILGAVSFAPSSYTFSVGEAAAITATISNPNAAAADYGDYDLKLAAKAAGFGIGVGPGTHFLLSLRDQVATDTTPPIVTVTKPAGDPYLGVIPVEIVAYDPDTPPPATGLASMSATVSSAGGTVDKVPLSLTLGEPLPVAAGVSVSATATFTPTGGAPGPGSGTTEAQAFTAANRSGIGSYTIAAQGTDVAGNTGSGSKEFTVNYQITFSKAFSTNPCQTGGNANCTGQFEFSVNRSSATSDGAFIFDHTVVAKLVRSDGTEVKSHAYGTGDIKDFVKIDPLNNVYQTNFKRGDIGAAAPRSYALKIYFRDVDNNLILQGSSNSVMF